MSDISEMNGGTAIAMAGDHCVCIGTDLRLGSRFLTICDNKEKVYHLGDRLFLGISGFASDCQTVLERIKYRKNLYELRENRLIKPKTFMHMLSNLLYEHRFGYYFIHPIVAGLDPITFEPYIASSDLIGSMTEPKDFVCCGTAMSTMAGMCETVWEPNMDPDSLFEATSQAMLAGLDRSCVSGWGAVVYTITKEKIVARTIRARLD